MCPWFVGGQDSRVLLKFYWLNHCPLCVIYHHHTIHSWMIQGGAHELCLLVYNPVKYYAGWWFQPSWKIWIKGNHYSHILWKIKTSSKPPTSSFFWVRITKKSSYNMEDSVQTLTIGCLRSARQKVSFALWEWQIHKGNKHGITWIIIINYIPLSDYILCIPTIVTLSLYKCVLKLTVSHYYPLDYSLYPYLREWAKTCASYDPVTLW